MKLALYFLITVFGICCFAEDKQAKTLIEQLGYGADDKLLIVNADDAGLSHGTNLAIIEGMEKGSITSATIMVPCPWATEIITYAVKNPQTDFGIHLTHTNEWKFYKWGTVSDKFKVPGLLQKNGFMHPSVKKLYANAVPMEAYTEAKAQIDKALEAGVKPTHIDSHMGALMYNLGYALFYIKLATEYNLPLRIPSQQVLVEKKVPNLRTQLDSLGILYSDYLIYGIKKAKGESTKDYWLRVIRELKPGVTELYIHPALPLEETKAITNRWKNRAEEFRLFTNDEDIKKALKENKVKLIGFRPLMELQQKKNRPPRLHH
jgi:predicted glycoside hydrolase/deacetylase ChbG (UPF0249 family)